MDEKINKSGVDLVKLLKERVTVKTNQNQKG